MKLAILSPDQGSWVDPPVHSILKQIPDINNTSVSEADCVIIPISYNRDFKFNEDLRYLSKPWALADFSEFGWQWGQKNSYLWGFGGDRLCVPQFGESAEYVKFMNFTLDNPPILTFQRELLQKDVTDQLIPIEYLSHLQEFGLDTKEEFQKRPLEVSYNWGRSHEDRMRMHGEIFCQAPNLGYDVISEFSHVDKAIADNPKSKKWLTVHSPHYGRIDVSEVQRFNRMSKVVIAMPGAGFKTFRHGEMCGDAIMAIPRNNLAWSYPWDDGNSIQIEASGIDRVVSVSLIYGKLQRDDLYQLYCNAMENARNYRYQEYLTRWVVGNIRRCL